MLVTKKISEVILLFILVMLSACAEMQGGRKKEHGFTVVNTGSSINYDIHVRYGSVEKIFCVRGCAPNVGTFYGVYMPIQDEISVSWKTSEGEPHEVKVMLKGRITALDRLQSFQLGIDGAHLTILEALEHIRVGEVGLEKIMIYSN